MHILTNTFQKQNGMVGVILVILEVTNSEIYRNNK